MTDIKIRPIGHVCRADGAENERDRTLVAEIVLEERLAGALDRLDEFSHVYVLCWFDAITSDQRNVMHHPGKIDGPPLGIFATRAPIRPNPIGLTLVEVVEREANVLRVRGLDALDGTPVLDIKPYPEWGDGQVLIPGSYRIPLWLTQLLDTST